MDLKEVRSEAAARRVPPEPTGRHPEPTPKLDAMAAQDLARPDRFDVE